VKSVATEVTRSNKISRAGWTDEERAAGRVLVVGDGSTPSQVAMEVEGKSVGDKGAHMEVDSSVVNSGVKKKKGKSGKGAVRRKMLVKMN
jgi:hypothetical protein